MCSTQQVVLILAATWVSSTIAIAPCCDYIINKLSVHKECYRDGQPPNQTSGGDLGTYVVATKGDLRSDVKCANGWQDDGHTYSTFFYEDNTKPADTLKWNARFYSKYIEESEDGLNTKYRVYVIHNEMGALSFYICISVSYNALCFKNGEYEGNVVACGSKPPTYVDALESIALAYGTERIAGEDGIEWESAKLEPLGCCTEGSMPTDIEVAVNFAGDDIGTGNHTVFVTVGCNYTTNNLTLAAVERAKECFNKLRITTYVNLEPCKC